MQPHMPLILVVGLILTGDDPKDEAARKELERHQGTWAVVAFEYDGQRTPPETLRTIERVVSGSRAIWKRDGETFSETTIELDPTKEPKAIDVIPEGGPFKGRRAPGIYRFDGEELTICMVDPGGGRPEAFTAGKGSGRTLMTLRRSRPEE
jgi:uncharacterized protein (TIGR03067 family)